MNEELTAALARADRQLALVNDGFAKLVEEARKLLASQGATETWAILGTRVAKQLDCMTERQQFAAEMVAAAAIQAAQDISPSDNRIMAWYDRGDPEANDTE